MRASARLAVVCSRWSRLAPSQIGANQDKARPPHPSRRGCRKGNALGAEIGENVNRRNWWSLVRGHRYWAIWEIGLGRWIDLPPNSKTQKRRQKYVRQENGWLARSFCRASFCLHSKTIAVAPRLRGPNVGPFPQPCYRRNQGVWFLGLGFKRTNVLMDPCAAGIGGEREGALPPGSTVIRWA